MNKVEKYIHSLPEDSKKQFEALRKIVQETVPGTTEYINYGILAYHFGDDKAFIGIGGYKDFVSLYPYGSAQVTKFAEKLVGYTTTKSAIQFPLSAELPKELIEAIIKDRIDSL